MNDKIIARITHEKLSPESVIDLVRSRDSGCVVTYVGLIRDNSRGYSVQTVEYQDNTGRAADALEGIIRESMQRWPLNAMAIYHRVGVLNVNDCNLVVAIGAGHRGEGLAACAFAVDQFKAKLPTTKIETYADGSIYHGHD
jgi:molybdopterin synthase catalytic subunit